MMILSWYMNQLRNLVLHFQAFYTKGDIVTLINQKKKTYYQYKKSLNILKFISYLVFGENLISTVIGF